MLAKEYFSYLPVRFADLDVHGHVNVSKYLDFIVTSRWHFAQETLKMSAQDFIAKGIGIYITKAETNFLRGIVGLQELFVTSKLKSENDSIVVIEFAIQSKDKTKTFCTGTFEQRFIDLKTNKPTVFPDWAKPYFYDEI